MKSSSENKCNRGVWERQSGQEYFVLKLETRSPGTVNCRPASLLAWIFHSDEHSQREQKLSFFPH